MQPMTTSEIAIGISSAIGSLINRLKPGFHMSGKSQTVWDFTVSRPSQIFPTYENWERFYFPDASQISTMVGDHSRQMKTQILTVGDVGVHRQWILLITKPLNWWAPVPLSQVNMAENMASLSRSNGYLYLESLAQEAKKTDTTFMDIIKEFPVL